MTTFCSLFSREETKNVCSMTGTHLIWLSFILSQDNLFLRSIEVSLLYSHVNKKKKRLPPGPVVPTEKMHVERSLRLQPHSYTESRSLWQSILTAVLPCELAPSILN